MKFSKILSMFLALALAIGAFGSAFAQLGSSDVSSFTVQNIDSVNAQVTVMFVSDNGTTRTPTELNAGKLNPFTLTPGESWEIYLPGIPDAQLPDGRYSVVISATAQVAAIANLSGQGSTNFNGTYSGLSTGASPYFLPGVVFNYYGWFSMISVQNVGAAPADVTLTITCETGAVGTLSAIDVPVNASYHFVLKSVTPTGFTGATSCVGSAQVTADQPIVAVDNQNVPTVGKTQSYSGVTSGTPTLYIPSLLQNYYGWVSALLIQKLEPGTTNVTVTYSDGAPATLVTLTDAVPSKQVYMPNAHPESKFAVFSATVTNSAGLDLVAAVNAANGSQAQTYLGVSGGTSTAGVPSAMKYYYGWVSSWTCQNVGGAATTLNVSYQSYEGNAYSTASLDPGKTIERYAPNEAFLPNGYRGAVTIVANNAATQIACIASFTNPGNISNPATPGDWSMTYNAFNK